MALPRSLLCLLLYVTSTGLAKDAKDDTVEGTIKAVAEAEGTADPKAKNSKSEKQNVKTEEAVAVAKATREVLKKEGHTNEPAPEKIKFRKKTLDKAEDAGKKTFKELADNGVDTKAAAAAAAESEIASADGAVSEVEGSSHVGLAKSVKLDAEKAAVAAGKAVADHPHDEAAAMGEAVKEVKKEEATGKADIKKESSKGLLGKAKEVVEVVPGVKKGEELMGRDFVLIFTLPLAAAAAFWWKNHQENNTPYLNNLKMIRQQFEENGEAVTERLQRDDYVQLQPFD